MAFRRTIVDSASRYGAALDRERFGRRLEQLDQALPWFRGRGPSTKRRPGASRADEDPALPKLDYEQTGAMIRALTDVPFKLLALVPTISGLGIVVATGRTVAEALAIGLVGLVATLGVLVYDLRNSQLFGAAIHRAKDLEERRGLYRSNRASAMPTVRTRSAATSASGRIACGSPGRRSGTTAAWRSCTRPR